MNSNVIFCLDDDQETLFLLEKELSYFKSHFDLISCHTIDSAIEILSSLPQKEQRVALFIFNYSRDEDQGVNLFINIDAYLAANGTRTILLHDQPNVELIMQAVNDGRLNYCMKKSAIKEDLKKIVKKELTQYVMQYCSDNLLQYCPLLEHQTLLDAHIESKLAGYRSCFIESALGIPDEILAKQLIDGLDEYFNLHHEHKVRRCYQENHILTHEGKENSYLWFVVEGEVALLKRDAAGCAHEVARLGQGSLIGGMSFVTGEVSFSTGVTLQKTLVIKLNRVLFSHVMQEKNDLLPLFSNYLLRHFNRRLKRSISTEVKLQQTLKSLEIAHKQLMEKEKMAMLGQLVAGVAHELNNPISAILRNSHTLKDTINQLINVDFCESAKEKANQIMVNALLSKPLSTADARQKSKAIEKMIENKNLARKAVNMGLDNTEELLFWRAALNDQFTETLQHWDMYYQAGSLLRSTHVCAQRIADMVKSLKNYAQPDNETMREIDLHEGIEDTLVMFENQLKHFNVIREYGDIQPLRCLPISLQQVWTNLIANALDAIDSNGEIRVKTSECIYNDRKGVQISFRDNGIGIPVSCHKKIFELNYTTKREEHFGLGIGLSVSLQIIEHLGGRMEVDSCEGQFTEMIVTLPYRSVQEI